MYTYEPFISLVIQGDDESGNVKYDRCVYGFPNDLRNKFERRLSDINKIPQALTGSHRLLCPLR